MKIVFSSHNMAAVTSNIFQFLQGERYGIIIFTEKSHFPQRLMSILLYL